MINRIVSSLLIAVLFFPCADALAVIPKAKSVLVETSRTAETLYFDLQVASKDPVSRVRITQVEADNAADADAMLAAGRSDVIYKRRTKPIRISSLKPGKSYCFKGNFITIYEYKGGSYATNENQNWEAEEGTAWYCTTMESGIPEANSASDTSESVVISNDLLIQNVEASKVIETRMLNNKEVNGHPLSVTIHNGGVNQIDASSMQVDISCIEKMPVSADNTVSKTIGISLISGASVRVPFFITRKMMQTCNGNFEIKLPNDDISLNNVARIHLDNDVDGKYNIYHH